MCPPKRGVAGGRYSTRMPCCWQPRSKEREWNSEPLSTRITSGRPSAGQARAMPRSVSQPALGSTACATAMATPAALGGSSERCRPSTTRVCTSSTRVSQGRPMQARLRSSTSSKSTLVWSICTTWSGRSVCGPALTWRKRSPAASAPSRALTRSRKLRAVTRARSALVEGAGRPLPWQSWRTCRNTSLSVGFSGRRKTVSIAASTRRSSAGSRRRAPLAGPGLDGARDAVTGLRWNVRLREYTCGTLRPSCRAAACTAALPGRSVAASGRITTSRRTASAQAASKIDSAAAGRFAARTSGMHPRGYLVWRTRELLAPTRGVYGDPWNV